VGGGRERFYVSDFSPSRFLGVEVGGGAVKASDLL
jgi:hypothetical protein